MNRRMSACRISTAIVVILATTCATAQMKTRIDDVLRKAVEEKHVPCVVAMVARGDSVVYQRAFGKQTDASTVTLPADSIFHIASMTKAVTSAALMQLVEKGRVKLDDSASTYLPELARVQVLEGFDESGKPKLRPPKSQVTVRQLLTHTSGFAYDFLDPRLARAVKMGAVAPTSGSGAEWLKAPLMFDPGTAWEYGIGIDWIGKLVEKVSGRSLEDYFRENIFVPLAMNDTFFNVPPGKQSRVVTVHQRNADGTLSEIPNGEFKPVTFFSGGGGLYSTAEDYLRFTRMLLGGGKLGNVRVLQPQTVAMMGRNQIGDFQLTELKSQIPQLIRPGAILPGSLDKFGFGSAINTRPVQGGRAANSMAWDGIFNTFYWIDPERKTTAVLMMQTLPFLDEASQSVFEEFERAVYAPDTPQPERR